MQFLKLFCYYLKLSKELRKKTPPPQDMWPRGLMCNAYLSESNETCPRQTGCSSSSCLRAQASLPQEFGISVCRVFLQRQPTERCWRFAERWFLTESFWTATSIKRSNFSFLLFPVSSTTLIPRGGMQNQEWVGPRSAWKGLCTGGGGVEKKQKCNPTALQPFLTSVRCTRAGHPPQANVFQTGSKDLLGLRATWISTHWHRLLGNLMPWRQAICTACRRCF